MLEQTFKITFVGCRLLLFLNNALITARQLYNMLIKRKTTGKLSYNIKSYNFYFAILISTINNNFKIIALHDVTLSARNLLKNSNICNVTLKT